MARRGSCLSLPAVLLVLLASGSRGSTVVPEELRVVVGQSLSVRCQYTPQAGSYVRKTWCRQIATGKCTKVITTSQPRTAVQEPRHTIWDDPQAGFFVVNITNLRQGDSDPYWCGSYHASKNTIFILRNITLVVSAAPSTARTWTTTGPSTPTALVTSAEGTPGLSFNGSEHSSPSSWDATCLKLLLLECGLLAAKALLLATLCVILCYRCSWGAKDTAVTDMMEISDYTSFIKAPEPLGTFSHILGRRRNTYSLTPGNSPPQPCEQNQCSNLGKTTPSPLVISGNEHSEIGSSYRERSKLHFRCPALSCPQADHP
ncbi:PREDICTED: trem-like transcript 4 protein isoform X1 [Chinchilla lanigera]|nr:PREDICTED: trem-like transcript 4 protein isoform X1 [Chinchilla lanigera]XP_013372562.1 PREDICTED: trem-like transcript 4 protein isoform X1 [Chinchilla lanigera]